MNKRNGNDLFLTKELNKKEDAIKRLNVLIK